MIKKTLFVTKKTHQIIKVRSEKPDAAKIYPEKGDNMGFVCPPAFFLQQ